MSTIKAPPILYFSWGKIKRIVQERISHTFTLQYINILIWFLRDLFFFYKTYLSSSINIFPFLFQDAFFKRNHQNSGRSLSKKYPKESELWRHQNHNRFAPLPPLLPVSPGQNLGNWAWPSWGGGRGGRRGGAYFLQARTPYGTITRTRPKKWRWNHEGIMMSQQEFLHSYIAFLNKILTVFTLQYF